MSTQEIQISFKLADTNSGKADPEELESIVGEVKEEIKSNPAANAIVLENSKKADGKTLSGPEWVPILTAILSAPAVVVSVKAIFEIIKDRIRKDPFLTIEVGAGGGTIRIGPNNLDDSMLEQLIELVSRAIPQATE